MQSKRPRRAVGITQPPNQWAQECLLLEVTLLIEMCVSLCGAIPSLPYVELYLHSLIRLHALIFNWIQRQTCLYLYFPSSYKYISKITTWHFFFLLGATTPAQSWPSQQFLSIWGDLGLVLSILWVSFSSVPSWLPLPIGTWVFLWMVSICVFFIQY